MNYMTLNTSLINRESQGLYLKYLKDPRIPDELCSEIYLEFVRRLEKQRRTQSRIEKNQLGIFIKWSLRTALDKRKKEKKHEEILTGIVERNASRLWCTQKNREEQDFFDRIARFLKEWVQKKANHPDYLHIFMLYHGFHLSPDFVDELGPYTSVNQDALTQEMEQVKEGIRKRVNRQLEKKSGALGVQYYHLIKKQKAMGSLRITQFDEDEQKEYDKARAKRKQALKLLGGLKFVPSWVQIEEISGISERKARYAYQSVTRAIRASFADDTYWG